jgi:predicted transcriptional regulator
MIRRLPDDVTVVNVMDELSFRRGIEEGLTQLDAGEGIEHEDAKKRLGKWLNPDC